MRSCYTIYLHLDIACSLVFFSPKNKGARLIVMLDYRDTANLELMTRCYPSTKLPRYPSPVPVAKLCVVKQGSHQKACAPSNTRVYTYHTQE